MAFRKKKIEEPRDEPVKKKAKLKDRFKSIQVRRRFKDARTKIRDRKMKTWKVSHVENPYDYEFIDAISEKDAIARSSYIEKEELVATVKPEFNVFILDQYNGSYKTYMDEKKIRDTIPDAKIYDFEGEYLFYLHREYDKQKNSKLVAYERPKEVAVSPEVLFEARNWKNDIKELIKTRDHLSLDKLSTPLLLGMMGMLVFLIVIIQDL